MYRKSRFWNRILFRISVSVLILGLASIMIVNYFVREQMRHNIENQITEEMLGIQNNSKLYIRQILLINDCRINEEGFEKCTYEIAIQLKSSDDQDIALYDPEGRLLKSSDETYFVNGTEREDFVSAENKKSAYTITYGPEKNCEVFFSMPVEIMNQYIGIISFHIDCSELYQREWRTISSMLRIMILVLGIIYVLIWVMIRQMVKPIRDLSRMSGMISGQLPEGKIDSEPIRKSRYRRRKDEIGELTRNYTRMIRVVEEQFEKIKDDRNRILRLWNSRQEFYNNVTHELKTPLTTISGYAQLIEENGLEDKEIFYNGIGHILQESTRLHRMVVQLLEMQNQESINSEEYLDITGIIKNVMDAMTMKAKRYDDRLILEAEHMGTVLPENKEKAAGRGISREGEKPENLYVVKGRADRIYQVFVNLIDNAIKYGEPKKDILIRVCAEEERIRVDVINEGTGMDSKELDAIFEPFYRVDKVRSRELGSSGLGLSITRKIMEEHGGSITAECSVEGCTVFHAYFPRAEREEAEML